MKQVNLWPDSIDSDLYTTLYTWEGEFSVELMREKFRPGWASHEGDISATFHHMRKNVVLGDSRTVEICPSIHKCW